jgi:hypothetical protein
MKKKNQKRNDALKLRSAIETLCFQTSWGLKKLGGEDGEKYGELAKVEVDYITELGLVQDILSIKELVDGIRNEFQVEPCVELGDFCNSLITIALGIGRVENLHNMGLPNDWEELMQKKLLKMKSLLKNAKLNKKKHLLYTLNQKKFLLGILNKKNFLFQNIFLIDKECKLLSPRK